MTSAPFLTIGIPTFNRKDALTHRLNELMLVAIPDNVEILVIDNASPDGTFDSIVSNESWSRVRALRNDENVGYAGNIVRLFHEARGDYLLVVSDEDTVIFDGLTELINFCQGTAPDFVSPRAQVGTNENYRGRKSTRLIEPEEFESSAFYISGLTFLRDKLIRDVEFVRELMPRNSAASVYPQVLLAAISVARGNSYFLDDLVTRQNDEVQSTITDSDGSKYFHVPGRWNQFRGYESFFSGELTALLSSDGAERLARMRDHKRSNFHLQLIAAAQSEFPELAPLLEEIKSKLAKKPFYRRLLERVRR